MAEEVKPGVSYTIGGVKVDFPVKAYPSQISMMDKVCITFISQTVFVDKNHDHWVFY